MAIIAALATFRDRIGIVNQTILSLVDQVDLLLIYCNDEEGYHAARKISKSGTVKTYWGENITDRGKFHFCKELKDTDNVYFACDDDLIYPPDYVSHTLERLVHYKREAIVSYHGKKLVDRNLASYYARLSTKQKIYDYRVLYNVADDHEVDLIGCGCMAFDLRYFCPESLQEDMMTDIEVSCLAEKQGKKRMVLEHQAGWVRYNDQMQGKWTIWDHFQKHSDKVQTDLINQTFQ